MLDAVVPGPTCPENDWTAPQPNANPPEIFAESFCDVWEFRVGTALKMTVDELADLLKSRNIESVCYFHTDHFEPWSRQIDDESAKAVERFAEMARRSRYAQKLSLFYCVFVSYHVDNDANGTIEGDRVEGDGIVFGRRNEKQERLASTVIRPLSGADGHELHLHVHHEFWTCNGSNFDSAASRWVNAHSSAEQDEQRLDLNIRLCKEAISREIGAPFERWGFIHGNWALGASDPLICNIEHEIAVLMRHGAFGDFSFPAGRGYCDPKTEVPFTCRPLKLRRVYDDPRAQPLPIGRATGVIKPDRFFIWNSPIKADQCSLDYYSSSNRDQFKMPDRLVSAWIDKSVCIENVLFIKTHAHSMKWEYRIGEPDSVIPHCYPDIVNVFETLERACERAHVELRFVTVNEVMDHLTRLDAQDTHQRVPNNRVSPPNRASSTPPADCPDSDGRTVGAALHSAMTETMADTGSPIVAPTRSGSSAISPEITLRDLEQLIGEALRDWVHADTDRLAGAGDFYLQGVFGSGRFLGNYEEAVLNYLISEFDAPRTRVLEIGVGYGILSMLLANAGFQVIAFEGDTARFAGIQYLLTSFADRLPELTQNYRPVFGWFPDTLDAQMLGRSFRNVLVTTNIVHSISDLNQERILRTAARFDDLIIDPTRFGVSRDKPGESAVFFDAVTKVYPPVRRIWRETSNEVWHLRPNALLVSSRSDVEVEHR